MFKTLTFNINLSKRRLNYITKKFFSELNITNKYIKEQLSNRGIKDFDHFQTNVSVINNKHKYDIN